MEVKLKGAQNPVDVPDHLAKQLARLNLIENAEAIVGPAVGEPTPEPASMSMRKAELVQLADERGLPVDEADTKADLVAKINAAAEQATVTVEGGEAVHDAVAEQAAELGSEPIADEQTSAAE